MSAETDTKESLRQCLIRIADGLAQFAPLLPEAESEDCMTTVSAMRRNVIPQLGRDFPLIVAVTGGGSTGKSSVFNALVGTMASAANPDAGYTRRMVAAIHPDVVCDSTKLNCLFERFRENSRPTAMRSSDEALTPGEPVYVECRNMPGRLVLVDTPDFDTGTREKFTNRDAAAEILSVSDVFLYLVTNTSYNNKSNTDFVREMLSGIGVRKVALLYRCSSAFSDAQVRKHMDVTLSLLYPDGKTAQAACIGVWRIDESNDVAAGTADPVIRPLAGGKPLREVLEGLDPTKTRAEILRSSIHDFIGNAGKWIACAETEGRRFAAYRDSLRFLTSEHSPKCLEQAPQREIVLMFDEEWEAAQPWAVRNGHALSRWTGRVMKGLRRPHPKSGGDANSENPFCEVFKKAFLEQANLLWNETEAPVLTFDFSKTGREMQPVLETLKMLAQALPKEYRVTDKEPKNREGLVAALVTRPSGLPSGNGNASPGDRIGTMADEAEKLMGDTESVRPEIRELVLRIRDRMTTWQRVREGLSASLDTVALAGAVAYVATTGDALTGGTLLSMFGINDLIAVPALGAWIAAHGAVDASLLQRRMNELFTTWAKEKAADIRNILEKGITGKAIQASDERCRRLWDGVNRLQADLSAAKESEQAIFTGKE